MARRRSARSQGPADFSGMHRIDSGEAEIAVDRDDPEGRFVYVNGVPSSYVHLTDPTILVFEYVQWIGEFLDVLAPAGDRLRVVHLGGAGCTLARYVAATRPGSIQVVFEIDAALAELMREAFDLRRRTGVRLRAADAREGLATLATGSQDVVIRDAFTADQVPAHLSTAEFAAEVARVLTPHGVYVANVADRGEQRQARSEAATVRTAFDHVVMVAEPGQLRGRGYGNVLLLASQAPLPPPGLDRRLASAPVRARVVSTERVAELVSGIRPQGDADIGHA